MLPLSECPRHPFTILAQLLFITALHELPDVCQQFLLRLWQTALNMEQIGGMFVHEDGVVVQAAHQFVYFLQFFLLCRFCIQSFLNGTIQWCARHPSVVCK